MDQSFCPWGDKMAELKIGSLVRSLAGHDKGGFYIIIKEDAQYVYLADGKLRPLGNPKRKKRKHVQPVYCGAKALQPGLTDSERVTDEAVKRFIKQYHQTDQKNPGR